MVVRTLAIFVIVALSGVPASVALCEGWCPAIEAPVASSGTACHATASSSAGPRLAGLDHGCDHQLSLSSALVDMRSAGSAARVVVDVEFSTLPFGQTAGAFSFRSARGSPPRLAVPSVTSLRI
jgi:hypothetical protein